MKFFHLLSLDEKMYVFCEKNLKVAKDESEKNKIKQKV